MEGQDMTTAPEPVPLSAKQILAGAKLPQTSVTICLRPDLVSEWERLDRELQHALRPADSLAGNGSPSEVAQQMDDVRAEMAAHSVVFVLQALPRRRFRAMMNSHPPRKTPDGAVDERDRLTGVNLDALWPDLLPASLVAPELDADDWALLIGTEDVDGVLTARQFNELADAVWDLNMADGTDVPFSRAVSAILRNSGSE